MTYNKMPHLDNEFITEEELAILNDKLAGIRGVPLQVDPKDGDALADLFGPTSRHLLIGGYKFGGRHHKIPFDVQIEGGGISMGFRASDYLQKNYGELELNINIGNKRISYLHSWDPDGGDMKIVFENEYQFRCKDDGIIINDNYFAGIANYKTRWDGWEVELTPQQFNAVGMSVRKNDELVLSADEFKIELILPNSFVFNFETQLFTES